MPSEIGAEQETNFVRIRVESKVPEMAGQVMGLVERLKDERVSEYLKKCEHFIEPYTSGKKVEDLVVDLKEGETGKGQVTNENGVQKVEVEMARFESDQSKQERKECEVLLGGVVDVDKKEEKFKELAFSFTASTVLHEGAHTLFDSRPNGENRINPLVKDFKDATGIDNDPGGHILSLVDEAFAYTIQRIGIGKIEGIDFDLSPNPREGEKSYCVNARKRLGEALQPIMEKYLKDGIQIDMGFLKSVGVQMMDKEIVDIEKYVKEAEYERSERILSGAAEKIGGKEYPTPLITNKEVVAPTGDKRDYVSMSPYNWQTENGGWETRDGEKNPLTEKYADENKLNKVSSEIILTSLAAEYTRDADKKVIFSQRANETLNSWFVNEETRMNPNLENAQLSNPDSESGNFYGIIEGDPLVRIVESVEILKKNGLISEETQKGVEVWFDQYLNWLTTSEKGIGNPRAENEKERNGEKGMKNNHGTFYDVQVAYIADFLGKTDVAKQTLESVMNRIASQIEPSGEMKEETARGEVSRDYQIFNLYAFSELAELGKKYDVDLWHFQTDDGRSLEKAFMFFDSQLRDAGNKPFKFDRTGPLYFAYKEAAKAFGKAEYRNLPNRYYNNALANEVSEELLRIREVNNLEEK